MKFITKHWKSILIIITIILAFVILLITLTKTTENKAIKLEEQISESRSAIDIQLKKRNDVVLQLVQVIENYTNHEQNIVDSVTEARQHLQNGETTAAINTLNIVVESYPEIKADILYINFMNEISICENTIANYRDNYNIQVKTYKKLTRTFPNTWFLSMAAYEVIDVDYLEFDQDELVVNTEIFGS